MGRPHNSQRTAGFSWAIGALYSASAASHRGGSASSDEGDQVRGSGLPTQHLVVYWTTMSVASVPNLSASPTLVSSASQLRPFTVDEYHKMIAAGVLGEDDPVELLEGWIKFKMPRNPAHDGTVEMVAFVIEQLLPTGWHVRRHTANTTDDSEPEPDVAVVAVDSACYFDRHPAPRDIALIVEVADTSLGRDRDEKLRVYARALIPAYWIVNLAKPQVEIYTLPSGPEMQPSYGRKEIAGRTDGVPLMLGDTTISVPLRQMLR